MIHLQAAVAGEDTGEEGPITGHDMLLKAFMMGGNKKTVAAPVFASANSKGVNHLNPWVKNSVGIARPSEFASLVSSMLRIAFTLLKYGTVESRHEVLKVQCFFFF